MKAPRFKSLSAAAKAYGNRNFRHDRSRWNIPAISKF